MIIVILLIDINYILSFDSYVWRVVVILDSNDMDIF